MKAFQFTIGLAIFLALLTGCGQGQGTNGQETVEPEQSGVEGTIVYESENGPVEIPAEPQRIVALTNAPNVISLGGSVVGVDEWTAGSPHFQEALEGVEVVSYKNAEQILALNPDLIIAGSHFENLEDLKAIAPTVAFTWGKLDYLEQQLEIGKLLHKEEEARAWIQDFTKRADELGKQVKEKIGKDATVSVLEMYDKSIYVYGNNWARGTEVLYQAMGLAMPDNVKKDALGPGYHEISLETIPEYAGDYIVLSRKPSADNEFLQTETWKNVPAVKADRVIEIDMEAATYSDPMTLEYLMNIFEEGFLQR
ncbi:iron-hydroxamate ABC transporter substrate-binding protein [Paenibacillus sp. J5C_2022]|uniref:iron-hydroxamate ABC transporter substrate-binding protein n=1 Tax=Paenibacillus sp. J5C2022 TaxID=2977129 RepID=UPI0021D215E1|nr:iron-hydroxamate ABC transporter substrate-binding protein [Paenibacillus sp. J5C2022]MCU6712809.1 iron-hydroxamate ABC transporter substrate-binding protein [Paenibacillus sp. J5C2022]